MHPAQVSGKVGRTTPSYAQAAAAASLTTLVYRSRATQHLSERELLGLTKAAQMRNRAESITGLVLYDDSRFFQWLEGPDESLSRVMHSINNDARHTDVEVLTRQPTRRRTFAGWDMKLALPGAVPAPWTREVIRPSLETVETLRRRPEIAASVIETLAPACDGAGRTGISAMIEAVVRTAVVPRLVSWHRASGPLVRPDPWRELAPRLADRLLTGDTDGAMALIRPEGQSSPAGLPEAAARHLGDRWLQDECSEFDVTLALCLLQTVIRLLEQDAPGSIRASGLAGTALVAPHPGEPHGLQAALSAHALRRAGWSVRCAFPASEAELGDLVAGHSFDALDLSLSAAFRREDRLAATAATIASARGASRNPALKITVAGRIFAEQDGLAVQVGADGVGTQAG